jgi:hypothetical protein
VFVDPLQQQFLAPFYRSFHFIIFSHNFIWRLCSTISYGASAAPFHMEPLNLTKSNLIMGKYWKQYGSL